MTDSTSGADYDFDYDLLGRVTSITQSIGGLTPTVVMTAEYDAAGRRTQLAASIGGTGDFLTDYAYDHLGRVDWIKQQDQSANTVAEKYVDFAFDLAGRPTRIDRYADLLGNDLVAVTDYLFDDAGRLTDLTHHDGATPTPTNFADYDLAYDEAGRITGFDFASLVGDDGDAGYTYDDTNQLTDADYADNWQAEEGYDYDDNGNRTNNDYSVDTNNQMDCDGVFNYTYDLEGNRSTRTRISQNQADDHLTEYTWDHRNRLTMVTFKNNSGTITKQVEYAYDYANRWVRKVVDPDGPGQQPPTGHSIFVYDGNQIALQFDDATPSDSIASASDLAHRYLWGTSVDQILADETVDDGGAEDVLWPLTDHLNTVRDLAVYDPQTDETTVANHLVYNAFGELISGTNPILFGFTARPFDPDTGLQNNLHRWYDATVGRWLSEDPIGPSGGPNLYEYVGNSPTRYVDPTGLFAETPSVSLEAIEYLVPPSDQTLTPVGHFFAYNISMDYTNGLILVQRGRSDARFYQGGTLVNHSGSTFIDLHTVPKTNNLSADAGSDMGQLGDIQSPMAQLYNKWVNLLQKGCVIAKIVFTRHGQITVTDKVQVVVPGKDPTDYDPQIDGEGMVNLTLKDYGVSDDTWTPLDVAGSRWQYAVSTTNLLIDRVRVTGKQYFTLSWDESVTTVIDPKTKTAKMDGQVSWTLPPYGPGGGQFIAQMRSQFQPTIKTSRTVSTSDVPQLIANLAQQARGLTQ